MYDYLIVGVNSDELAQEYKHKIPVINETNRAEIVRNIKAVDEAVIVHTLDKQIALESYRFDVIFIGDDWKGNSRWEQTRIELKKKGVDLLFLPHTDGVSSTELKYVENKMVED